MRVLNDDDIGPEPFSGHMVEMLSQKRAANSLAIDLNGAANAAEFLTRWGGGEIV